MKTTWFVFPALLVIFASSLLAQKTIVVNLRDAVRRNKVEVYNRELTLLQDTAHPGIRLSKAYGEGIAWMKGITFSTGTIEFDVRGEDVRQHSFVGLAFHGQNDSTYDAVYLRPFHFQAPDAVSRHRMIQYISLPEFTWRKLREQFPDKYENEIEPALLPNDWVHVRIEVKGKTISTFINNQTAPSLVVEKLTDTQSGKIGFYVADTSGGEFANLQVKKAW